MTGEERRACILRDLKEADRLIRGTTLAIRYGVSRQVIVGDISLLRAAGIPIYSCPRGYSIKKCVKEHGLRYKIQSKLRDDNIATGLMAVVRDGGQVYSIGVEHKVYGNIEGKVSLKTEQDVIKHMKRLHESKSSLLSSVCEGEHYLYIDVPDEETYIKIRNKFHTLGLWRE